MIINMGALNLKSLSLEKDSCVIAQIVLVDRKLGQVLQTRCLANGF